MNLFRNFSVKYLNFSGYIDKEEGIFYYFDFLETGDDEVCKELSNCDLLQIFDTFYGGSIRVEEENENITLELRKILVRVIYFEENNLERLVAIGHAQKNLWILKSSNKLVTEEEVIKTITNEYLIKTIKRFPRGIDKFVSTLKDNSYEICELVKNKNVDPLDYWEVFEEVAKKYIQKR